jgi:hypothetical protein
MARFQSPTLPETEGEWLFDAAVDGTSLRIELPPGRPLFDWMLLETLPNGYFALTGRIDVPIASTGLRGTLNGAMALHEGSGGRIVETAICRDAGHVVTIRR